MKLTPEQIAAFYEMIYIKSCIRQAEVACLGVPLKVLEYLECVSERCEGVTGTDVHNHYKTISKELTGG